MKLLLVELRRFWSRRLMTRLVIAVALGIITYGVVLVVTHSPEKPSIESVQAEIDATVQECRSSMVEEYERTIEQLGEEDPRFLEDFPDAAAFADEICNPSHFGIRVHDPRFCIVDLWKRHHTNRDTCPDFDDTVEVLFGGGFGPDGEDDDTVIVDGVTFREAASGDFGIVPAVSLALVMLSVLLGATFVGSEYRAGTVETQLLWEPRRKRVLGAKLAAAGSSAFALHALMLALLVAVALPAAWWRGTTAGADSVFWSGLGWTIVRGAIISSVAAVIAAAVTAAARYTAAVFALVLGYAIIGPVQARFVFRGFRPWDLIENAFAFANNGDVARYEFSIQFQEWTAVFDHGPAPALFYVAGYVAVIVWVTTVVFSRRDIT